MIRKPEFAKDIYGAEIEKEQIEGESFGNFLKRHGLLPPDMMGYNEEEQ